MIRFNIIGLGFLDMDAGAVAIKAENQQFRFCDISLGRTTEFNVPANIHNRKLLDYPEMLAEYGDAMRRTYDAQMVYDGGLVPGLLEVRGWDNGAYRCVFYLGASKTLEKMLDRPLSECETTLEYVQWDKTPTKAFEAVPAHPLDVIAYVPMTPGDKTLPSVHVKTFCEDVLGQLGALCDIQVDPELWMVAPTMIGGTSDNGVHLIQSGTNAASVWQLEHYFDVVDIGLEWAAAWLFGALVGGGTVSSKGFKVLKACELTFGAGIPQGVFMVKWQPELSQCCTLGGVDTRGIGDDHTKDGQRSLPLDNLTVKLKAGDIFFFAPNVWHFIGSTVYYGYKDNKNPIDLTVDVMGVDGNFVAGQKWYMRNNMPNMTVFEFLKSVALATGNELTVTSVGTQPKVTIAPLSYGSSPLGSPAKLDRVVSIDRVSRKVMCWGDGTRSERVRFDSNGVVTALQSEPLVEFFSLDNDQLDGEDEHVAGFSEGGVGDDNEVIINREVDVNGGSGARWTLGLAGSQGAGHSYSYLGRVGTPDVGYADLASCSTCMECRVHMSEADFMALSVSFGAVFQWRGGLYAWTDATWSKGLATLVLQKVSQPQIGLPTP